MKNILPDYHLHTTLCNHANGKMEEYVEHALEIGLKEIGFADHMPVMPEPHLCMSYNELPYYVEKVHEVQERYKGMIAIKLGCEMDIVHERLNEIEKIIRKYPFDYVIGSIHYLDDWPFDQDKYKDEFENGDINKIYERFFDAIILAAETGIYDIVGHVDNIKRMGYRPHGDITPLYERVASVLNKKDLTVEINTSGFDRTCREQYPSLAFLKVLRSFDIPVTIGSDAHGPQEVGRYFDTALSTLQEAGYDNVVYFHKRKRIFKPIKVQNSKFKNGFRAH